MLIELIESRDPRLRQPTLFVPRTHIHTSIIQDAIEALILTLELNQDAVGIAAPQLGFNHSIFVARLYREPAVFINPMWDFLSMKKVPVTEECLSLPGRKQRILRYESVGLSAYNQEGVPFYVVALGVQQAAVLQHEMDHLNGVLIIDRPAIRRKLGFI